MKFILSINLLFLFYSCGLIKTKENSSNNAIQECFLLEENFSNSSMRVYLESMQNNRDIINKFIKDSSSISFLSLENNKFIFARSENSFWEVFNEETNYKVRGDTILTELKNYANLNLIYKLSCPDGYTLFSQDNGFYAYWIKEKGRLKFMFYTTSYSINSLNDEDRKKIVPLKEINQIFKN